MSNLLRQHDNCRLYTKISTSNRVRYFVSKKATSLKRLQILKDTADLLQTVHDGDFVYSISMMLENAKTKQADGFREILIDQNLEQLK
jgi:hypothetical protein